MSIDYQAIKAEYPLLEVISRYVELRQRGGSYYGLCPFHDDKDPSMQVWHGKDGTDRWRCWSCEAGGKGGDVIDFVAEIHNVETVEACKILTNDKLPEIGNRKLPRPIPVSTSHEWKPIIPVPDDAPEIDTRAIVNPKRDRVSHLRSVDRIDPYLDAEGKLICVVLRLTMDQLKKSGKNKKIIITCTYCKNVKTGELAWCMVRPPTPYPLQGLDMLAAHPHSAVLIVSGEKCRDYAVRQEFRGYVPVTLMGGDEGVADADLTPLKGRDVTFWPDADPPGRMAMLNIFNRLQEINE